VVAALCERLLAGGVPALHFYTMNPSAPSLALWAACRR
jgi:methylenetetrahydrofolate reductase (NADPH)